MTKMALITIFDLLVRLNKIEINGFYKLKSIAQIAKNDLFIN
jgi:hypothetical protein